VNDESQGSRLQSDGQPQGQAAEKLPPPSIKKSRSAAKRLAILGVILVLGGAVLGQWLYTRYTNIIVYDARISADVVAVSSRVGGWITSMPVSEGQLVTEGQPLILIDNRDSRLRLKELDARLAGIESERREIETQITMVEAQTSGRVRAGEAELAAARAVVAGLATEVKQAESDFIRAQSLLQRSVISKQRWESLRTRYQTVQQLHLRAKADVAKARAGLQESQAGRRQIEVLQNRLTTLQHDHEQASVERERQRLDLDDRAVKSALNGVVDKIFVDVGEYVSGGQRVMMIHNPDSIWINANVKETDIRDLAIGAEAQISVDAYPDLAVTGKVVRIGHAATSQFALLPNPNPSGNFTKITQRLPVKIAIEQVDGHLRPGMMVEVMIAISRD
jgi:membrane fusion protein (multidrug efflux system)